MDAPPTLADRLLDWYDRHARELPWRVPPARSQAGERPDPYHVWLSEVMLQQTTVAAVRPYFERFLARWPALADLAAASDEEVAGAWAGLGYYSRARNLAKCARAVVAKHDGRFPQTADALRRLPGIGVYTSAAIAAIAFGERAAVVDGNIERVVSRLEAIPVPPAQARAQIRACVDALTPADRPGDFAQAMMDLGATVCTPRRPACMLCPLMAGCAARAGGEPERFPVRAPRKTRVLRRGAAFVAVSRAGRVLLRRRPASGLLGGMAEPPGTDWSAKADGETGPKAAPFPASWRKVGEVAHGFTHFDLSLDVYLARGTPESARIGGWWAGADELGEAGLPTLMRKVVELALGRAIGGPAGAPDASAD